MQARAESHSLTTPELFATAWLKENLELGAGCERLEGLYKMCRLAWNEDQSQQEGNVWEVPLTRKHFVASLRRVFPEAKLWCPSPIATGQHNSHNNHNNAAVLRVLCLHIRWKAKPPIEEEEEKEVVDEDMITSIKQQNDDIYSQVEEPIFGWKGEHQSLDPLSSFGGSKLRPLYGPLPTEWLGGVLRRVEEDLVQEELNNRRICGGGSKQQQQMITTRQQHKMITSSDDNNNNNSNTAMDIVHIQEDSGSTLTKMVSERWENKALQILSLFLNVQRPDVPSYQ